MSSTANSQPWEIHSIIKPTIEDIEWFEEGVHPGSPSWISDGRWNDAHSRLILVKAENYIFATYEETFNWEAVNEGFDEEMWHPYPSFEDFKGHILADPRWWLLYSWGLEADWLGISLETTQVLVEFDPNTGWTYIRMSCRITNIPEYFTVRSIGGPPEIGIGGKKLPRPLFAGLALTGIYIGDFQALEWYEDYMPDHSYYRILFKAPFNLLDRYEDTYSLELSVAPHWIGQTSNVFRIIRISMPSDTEVHEASPSELATFGGNTVTFAFDESSEYPELFSVTSGPPVKEFSEFLIESIGDWVTSPEAWLALVSIVALGYGAFSGKRLWDKRKTYYRLYRSMVSVYDRYSQNYSKFSQEIDNLSESITKYFIEDKINDDQLDKLLTRRDDLIERAKKLQEKG